MQKSKAMRNHVWLHRSRTRSMVLWFIQRIRRARVAIFKPADRVWLKLMNTLYSIYQRVENVPFVCNVQYGLLLSHTISHLFLFLTTLPFLYLLKLMTLCRYSFTYVYGISIIYMRQLIKLLGCVPSDISKKSNASYSFQFFMENTISKNYRDYEVYEINKQI